MRAFRVPPSSPCLHHPLKSPPLNAWMNEWTAGRLPASSSSFDRKPWEPAPSERDPFSGSTADYIQSNTEHVFQPGWLVHDWLTHWLTVSGWLPCPSAPFFWTLYLCCFPLHKSPFTSCPFDYNRYCPYRWLSVSRSESEQKAELEMPEEHSNNEKYSVDCLLWEGFHICYRFELYSLINVFISNWLKNQNLMHRNLIENTCAPVPQLQNSN